MYAREARVHCASMPASNISYRLSTAEYEMSYGDYQHIDMGLSLSYDIPAVGVTNFSFDGEQTNLYGGEKMNRTSPPSNHCERTLTLVSERKAHGALDRSVLFSLSMESQSPAPGNLFAYVFISTRNDSLLPDKSRGILPPISTPFTDSVYSWVYNESLSTFY